MTKQSASMWVGSQDGYEWLVCTHSLGDLLSVCPEIVMGKFVAVTAFDSGPLALTEEELSTGWKSQSGVAYSPKIADVNSLPFDNCYDEWYVFDEPTDVGRIAEEHSNIFDNWPSEDAVYRFVNYHLGLQVDEQKPLSDLFWNQIHRVRPEVYVADCQSYVTMVSKNKELFAVALDGIKGLSTS